MKNTILIVIFSICLFSCKKENSTDTVIKPTESLTNSEKINLDYFEAIPDTIDGCSYSFWI
ncbi:hypothetical protein [Flavobacterium mesophilum]|uniref:hypothetical protein n=1 Tax=Flavobacterium mesophilum TaxID=3143495 RepID=UPI0031E0BFDD